MARWPTTHGRVRYAAAHTKPSRQSALAPPARLPCDQGRDRGGGPGTWGMGLPPSPPQVASQCAIKPHQNELCAKGPPQNQARENEPRVCHLLIFHISIPHIHSHQWIEQTHTQQLVSIFYSHAVGKPARQRDPIKLNRASRKATTRKRCTCMYKNVIYTS